MHVFVYTRSKSVIFRVVLCQIVTTFGIVYTHREI